MLRLRTWFRDNRTAARPAYVLRMATTVAGALLSLFWTRALLRAFGEETFGVYSAFLGYLGLASAGELGMGGAVSVRTLQMLATGQFEELRRLHGTARRVFLLVSVAFGLVALALAPWLPSWLGFHATATSGSLSLMFAVGAVSVGLAVYTSYLGNSLYAAGSVMWPILPGFVVIQSTAALQVILGLAGVPLWVVHAGVVIVAVAGLWVIQLIYRHSHPIFQETIAWPAKPMTGELAATAGWSYLFGLGALVYNYTDRLIINAFFGPREVPVYQFNGKLCELAVTVVITAGGVAMPKVLTRLLSEDSAVHGEGRASGWKLARFQSLMGLALGVGYLWINDFFVVHFFGAAVRGEILLQAAFAVSLVIGANLDLYIQLGARSNASGLRLVSLTVLGTTLLNLLLSFVAAAHLHWLPGVQYATCLAQAAALLVCGGYVQRECRFVSGRRIWTCSFLLPLVFIAGAIALRLWFPPDSIAHAVRLAGIDALLLVAYGMLAGPRFSELRGELEPLRRAWLAIRSWKW